MCAARPMHGPCTASARPLHWAPQSWPSSARGGSAFALARRARLSGKGVSGRDGAPPLEGELDAATSCLLRRTGGLGCAPRWVAEPTLASLHSPSTAMSGRVDKTLAPPRAAAICGPEERASEEEREPVGQPHAAHLVTGAPIGWRHHAHRVGHGGAHLQCMHGACTAHERRMHGACTVCGAP